MGIFFYNFLLFLYGLGIRIASIGNRKAKKFLEGRRNIFEIITAKMTPKPEKTVWFHCASLGEFEQARPVIELFRQKNKNFFIIITFFSPSGYEIRKNYAEADAVFYLPTDSQKNAILFLDIIQPEIVYFAKYDFWHYYLSELKKRHIPAILFSALFRENQLFFKSYGGFYRNLLSCFSHIFVQNQESADLLYKINIKNVTVAGDTRFDRVKETVEQKKDIPLAAAFKNGQKLLVVGSCWAEDLAIILPFINAFDKPLKTIIAPHEIDETYLKAVETKTSLKVIRFSKAIISQVADYEILLIDNVGLLAGLYQYGEFAFVGGAFRQGLHNILEPATFGMPVFFGTDYRKYPEAKDLIDLQGAFSVKNTEEFTGMLTELYANEEARLQCAAISRNYILQNTGATEKIMAWSGSQ